MLKIRISTYECWGGGEIQPILTLLSNVLQCKYLYFINTSKRTFEEIENRWKRLWSSVQHTRISLLGDKSPLSDYGWICDAFGCECHYAEFFIHRALLVKDDVVFSWPYSLYSLPSNFITPTSLPSLRKDQNKKLSCICLHFFPIWRRKTIVKSLFLFAALLFCW